MAYVKQKRYEGKQFGDLKVISYDGRRGGKHYWLCRCCCGNEKAVCQSNLTNGHTRSCGCRVNPQGTFRSKTRYLGSFGSLEEASRARKQDETPEGPSERKG